MTLENISVSLFLPNLAGGGAERIMLNLAQGFAERGLKVDLVLAKVDGAYLTQVPPEVRVIDLRARFPMVLSKTLALIRYLRQEQPMFLLSALDIVSAATWAQRLARVPTRVVMTLHNNLSQQFQDKPEGIGGRVRSYLVRWFYPWADAIVAVSHGVAEDLACMSGLPLKNIQVIYNPVVRPDVFEKAKEPINHPWFAIGEPPVILGVGRLVKQKDFPTLIRAFALVRQRHPARLLILGDVDKREPSVRPQMEALIQELGLENEVSLPGFVENPYTYMARAAVITLSSVHEGLPNVLIEAMAVGTSVVSTECPSGPVEILENGKYGRLVPVGDVDAMANAILTTLSQPTALEVLQQRSEVFSIEKVIDQYLEVLSKVLSSDIRQE